MIPKDAEKAIAEHFEVPQNIRRLANQASWDLYYGPGYTEDENEDGAEYPGFSEACSIVSDWCNDALSDVWYDNQCGSVLDHEPEGYWEDEENSDILDAWGEPVEKRWVEPEWEDIYHFELKDVKRALFDKALCAHI